MKKIILFSVFIILFSNFIFGQDTTEKYSSITEWSASGQSGEIIISGKVRIQVTFQKTKNGYHIHVQKDMTPYGEILNFETDAVLNKKSYIFSCLDNWENNIFGSFKFEKDNCIFFLDCKKYSENGKNLGRLYGDTHNLEKKSIIFE